MTEATTTFIITVLSAVIAALVIALAVMSIKLYLMKKDARSIDECLDDILKGDTNALITLSGSDKDMRALAVALNSHLAVIRRKQLTYNNGDAELKNAMTNVAHDLRTPLTTICGYLDLISTEKDAAKIRSYADIAKERASALKALTDELFRYSVSLDKNRSIHLQEICLNSVISERVLDFYDELTEKGISPVIELPDKNINTIADKRDVSRIFDNLISNAVKYGEKNLKIKLDEDGSVTISNSTSKLTHLDVEKMFDRFYTVKNYNYSTGLGLSIAKSLVEQYGGSISASLENGVFSITLNLAKTR